MEISAIIHLWQCIPVMYNVDKNVKRALRFCKSNSSILKRQKIVIALFSYFSECLHGQCAKKPR